MREEVLEVKIALGTDHEEGRRSMHLVKSRKIQISSIHDIESAWLYRNVVQDIDFVNLAVRNEDHCGNASA